MINSGAVAAIVGMNTNNKLYESKRSDDEIKNNSSCTYQDFGEPLFESDPELFTKQLFEKLGFDEVPEYIQKKLKEKSLENLKDTKPKIYLG